MWGVLLVYMIAIITKFAREAMVNRKAISLVKNRLSIERGLPVTDEEATFILTKSSKAVYVNSSIFSVSASGQLIDLVSMLLQYLTRSKPSHGNVRVLFQERSDAFSGWLTSLKNRISLSLQLSAWRLLVVPATVSFFLKRFQLCVETCGADQFWSIQPLRVRDGQLLYLAVKMLVIAYGCEMLFADIHFEIYVHHVVTYSIIFFGAIVNYYTKSEKVFIRPLFASLADKYVHSRFENFTVLSVDSPPSNTRTTRIPFYDLLPFLHLPQSSRN